MPTLFISAITISSKMLQPYLRTAFCVAGLLLPLSLWASTNPGRVSGKVLDPRGVPVAGAHLKLLNSAATVICEAKSNEQGSFILGDVEPGEYQLTAEEPTFVSVTSEVSVARGQQEQVTLQFLQLVSVSQALTVVASAPSLLTPDPAQSIVIHDQVLDANPGRPGAPISIPGLPIETASGGIKAPQYFAPGVAGDHGEPIAQYFQIGDFLYPNNLPANAHGNGYSDPNFLIPPTIEAVTVNGGAFNVRQGNNSVDLAASYVPRERFNSFIQVTGDYRDADVMAGWSPANRQTNAWLAMEASFGNGFLERLEHRQQYKLNGLRQFTLGRHELTLFGIGYYGFSYVPGLIPIDVPVPSDTIDNRQLDRTHTVILVATDNWKLSERSQFSFSGFFRNYALTLRSNFGDGLIQQSESRNVAGGEVSYVQSVRPWLSLLAGLDLRQDAPRNLDLKHVDDEGVFQPVTSNNLTLSFVEPFVSVDGSIGKHVHYDLGVRQEQVWMDNQDLINPQNSFNKLATLTLPKGTLTLLPPDRWYLPMVAFSTARHFIPKTHESELARDNLPCCRPRVHISLCSRRSSSRRSFTLRFDAFPTLKSWRRSIPTRVCKKLSALLLIRCLRFPSNETSRTGRSTSRIRRRMRETPRRANMCPKLPVRSGMLSHRKIIYRSISKCVASSSM